MDLATQELSLLGLEVARREELGGLGVHGVRGCRDGVSEGQRGRREGDSPKSSKQVVMTRWRAGWDLSSLSCKMAWAKLYTRTNCE